MCTSETVSVAVNGSLYKHCLYDISVHFGCFLTPSVVAVQLVPWSTEHTPLRQMLMGVILTRSGSNYYQWLIS